MTSSLKQNVEPEVSAALGDKKMKRYFEFTDETIVVYGVTVYRIRATEDIDEHTEEIKHQRKGVGF